MATRIVTLVLLIQSTFAAEECGFSYSSRKNDDSSVHQSGRVSSKEHFGNLTIPIAIYTDQYFDARFKPLNGGWTTESKEKYRNVIVSIMKTASIAYKYDHNIRSVADISFKIVHVATSTINTTSEDSEYGEGDKIANQFEKEQYRDKNSLGKRWKLAILFLGINAHMSNSAGKRKKRPGVVTGLSAYGTFCKRPNDSGLWVEGKSMTAGLVTAHEIGHA